MTTTTHTRDIEREFHGGQSRQFLLHHAAVFAGMAAMYDPNAGEFSAARHAHYRRIADRLTQLASYARDVPRWPFKAFPA